MMFHFRKRLFHLRGRKRRPSTGVATPRVGRAPRLSIEAMESRLMLSGNQIDYEIWNLDSLQSNYAVISQGGTLSGNQLTNDADFGSTNVGSQLDVSWVQVPGMYLNRQQASELAFRHVNDAVARGVVTQQFASSLMSQFETRFGGTGANTSLMPVFAIGVGARNSGLDGNLGNGLPDYDLDAPGGDVFVSPGAAQFPDLAFFGEQATRDSTKIWVSSFDSSRLFGVAAYDSSSSFVLAGDRLQGSWQLKLVDDVGAPLLRDALDSFADFQSTLDVALNDALANPVVDVALIQDSTVIASPVPTTPTKVETITATPSTIDQSSNGMAIVVQPTAPVALLDLGAQIIVNQIADTPSPNADNLQAAVDELLAEDAILEENAATFVANNGAEQTGQMAAANDADGDAAAAPEATMLAEGGMVPVESIVGAVVDGELEIAPGGEQLVGTGDASELVGDLARVAVMELIEGAEEPMAPLFEGDAADGDHVAVLAAHDAAGSVQFAKVARGEIVEVRAAIRAFAEQAVSTAAYVMPMSPGYLTALVTTASDAFTALAHGEHTNASVEAARGNSARDDAFAAWGEASADSPNLNDEDGISYLGTLPILAALAAEHMLASKRRRKQAKDAPSLLLKSPTPDF